MATPKKLSKIKKTPKGKKAAEKTIKKLAKKTAGKVVIKKPKKIKKLKKYYEAVGRRKTAIARVRLFPCQPFEGNEGKVLINDKPYIAYFTTLELQQTVVAPLQKMKSLNRFGATVKVNGGGQRGQAEAIRHGLARSLVKFNQEFSKKLKRAGFLRRDPRQVERKKPGLKKARRAPQWRKR